MKGPLPVPRRSRPDDDRGDIVLGWLTKIAVFFALAGLVLFDAISVGTTHVTLSDQASTAAFEASVSWQDQKNVQTAYDVAVQNATDSNALNEVDPDAFRIDPDGTAHVSITRDATTLVLRHIGPIKDWAHITRDGKGRDVG
jgi:hypothetical protein